MCVYNWLVIQISSILPSNFYWILKNLKNVFVKIIRLIISICFKFVIFTMSFYKDWFKLLQYGSNKQYTTRKVSCKVYQIYIFFSVLVYQRITVTWDGVNAKDLFTHLVLVVLPDVLNISFFILHFKNKNTRYVFLIAFVFLTVK